VESISGRRRRILCILNQNWTGGWVLRIRAQRHGTAAKQDRHIQVPHVSKEQTQTENGADYGDVHRVADVSIEASNHQMARWKDRCRRAESLHCESGERIQKADHPDGNQDETNGRRNHIPKKGGLSCQCEIHHGTRPATKPGAMARKMAEPATAEILLSMS
jgi:hypothetical protein